MSKDQTIERLYSQAHELRTLENWYHKNYLYRESSEAGGKADDLLERAKRLEASR